MTTDRKPHVRVPQHEYLTALREVGGGLLDDIAEHFDVSDATARRMLDGLVAQDALTVQQTPQGRWYEPTEQEER